jgi:hypothetical protein
MPVLKCILALSGLTGILGALAFAVPANASIKAQCTITAGVIKAVTTKPTAKKYVQTMGGKGTFTFDGGQVVCTETASTKGLALQYIGTFTASGTFRNSALLPNGQWMDTPCGQGKVLGKITGINMGGTTKFNSILNSKFAVEFGPPSPPVQGAFFWHTAGPANKTLIPKPPPNLVKLQPDGGQQGKPNNPNGTKPYRWAGDIQISVSTGLFSGVKNPFGDFGKFFSSPADKCSKSFDVVGSITVHEA